MAYDVSALTGYTEQNNFPLLTKSLFGAKTMGLLTPMTGVKSAEAINILETDAIFQAGGICGFLSSGATAFTQRVLTVGKIKINESTCPKTLEAYYLQTQLQAGSRYEDMPFEEIYTNEKAGKIAQQLEIAVWQGDTTDTDVNKKRFDGLLKIIDAIGTGGGVIPAFPGTNAAVITSANVISIFDNLYQNIPVALLNKNDFVIFCGWDVFRLYTVALKNQNLYHYDGVANQADGELIIPGTNIKVIAVNGLNLANHAVAQSSTVSRIIGLRLSTTFFGCDLMNEEDKFEIFFAKEADEIRFVTEFKAGTQIAFPFEVVEYGV